MASIAAAKPASSILNMTPFHTASSFKPLTVRLVPMLAQHDRQTPLQPPSRNVSTLTRPRQIQQRVANGARKASAVALVPAVQIRQSSHSPLGAAVPSGRKKITLQTLASLHRRREPITMITAHDFPSAHVADHAGMDIVLVGDSLAMVALGMEDTSEVLLEEMLLHCRSVSRGAKHAFIVGDLPMGSYELSPEQALSSAIRFIKEGRVHSIKLEGGAEMAPSIRKITQAGIPVLAHIGLTPQRQHALGGFRVQGKTVQSAMKLWEDATAVQDAGAFGVVLEAVPEELATMVTNKLKIPTIGIGAGSGTSGQVLVQIDMSGNYPPGRFLPKFVKKFGDVWGESMRAVEAYGREVRARQYPAKEHTYPVDDAVLAQIKEKLGFEG